MKKGFILMLVLSLFCLSIPQTTIFAENNKVVINVDSLNVRSGPGLSYSVVAGLTQNQELEVLAKEGDWIKVKISNSLSGWVASWLVTEKKKESKQTESVKEEKLESTADGLRIRKGPGTSFQVVGSVNKGDLLQFKERSESWVKISYQQFEGWVHRDYVKGLPSETTTPSKDEKVIIKKGKITATSLNVRLSPSLNAVAIGSLKQDELVNIYAEKYDWYEINIGNKTGWVHKDYVKLTSEDAPSNNDENDENDDTTSTGQIAVVTATSLNVRDDFSLKGKVIAQVKKGDQLEVVSEQNNWCQVKLPDGKTGWVAGWYVEKKTSTPPSHSDSSDNKTSTVSIIYDTTNIRSGPSTKDSIIHRAMQGDSFTIVEKVNDWYKITLSDGSTGYVAGWIVSTTGEVAKVERPGMNQYLTGKTVVIDPGHGGRDSGAKGVRGTFEKALTLRAAKLLDEKLRAAGANPVLTRNQDVYVSLNNRVSLSHYYQADAFVSLHFDSSVYPSANGVTTYYYNKSKDYSLGQSIQTELVKYTTLRDRGVQYGNYHILRTNNRPSVLLELGFLSNITEEALVGTSHYQEQITTAIFNGLAYEFKK
ncbi:SH3 domain-containing protein [Bacillus pinisoli]|uniref:SH3 domain-containing protein n=1 Tax=Bacillus pinisoli TaxID=2901866 RepID=UPI001FF5F5A7|nr:SH3 domain-containing protein [Bacillus pinisoli]